MFHGYTLQIGNCFISKRNNSEITHLFYDGWSAAQFVLMSLYIVKVQNYHIKSTVVFAFICLAIL